MQTKQTHTASQELGEAIAQAYDISDRSQPRVGARASRPRTLTKTVTTTSSRWGA